MDFETMATNQLSLHAFNISTPKGQNHSEIFFSSATFFHLSFLASVKYQSVYTYLNMITPPHKTILVYFLTLSFKKQCSFQNRNKKF